MNLDEQATFTKYDTQNMRGSIALLHEQIKQTWDEVNNLDISARFTIFDSILFCGMGGSALGAYVAKHLYGDSISVPFGIINDYHIPKYAGSNTLVIVETYSGTTEEAISCLEEAHGRGCKVFAIATGKNLIEIAQEKNIPYFKINPINNPSHQPRMGIGYSIFVLFALLTKLKQITCTTSDITLICDELEKGNNMYGPTIPSDKNTAKQLAVKLNGKIPLFLSGEHIIGALHANRNQYNENAKNVAVYFSLPDADHFLLEGLQFPTNLKEFIHCVFYTSSSLSEKIRNRITNTEKVFKEHAISTTVIDVSAPSKLVEVMRCIQFGAYVGFYSAMLHCFDPSPVPTVENFKQSL